MTADRDALMGQLLEAWLDDLRNDRPPRQAAFASALAPDDVDEVMRLARWYKSVLYPSPGGRSVDSLASAIGAEVERDRLAQDQLTESVVSKATSFAEALRLAAEVRGIDLLRLEAACDIQKASLLHVAAGTQPPHRLPTESMVRVFRGLRLPLSLVAVLRRSSLEWARDRRAGAPVMFNVSASIGSDEDSETSVEDDEAIEAYCTSLAQRLG